MKRIKELNSAGNAVKPFWSWNAKLEAGKLCVQMDAMKSHGIDGFFMHARGGLETEYMSDEWMELIKACLDHSEETDMQAWAYDENGWPSGFANGVVPKCGEDYQQKWLVVSYPQSADKLPERLLGLYRINKDSVERISDFEEGCLAISYDVNIYYVDTFNKEAIKCFIDNTHQKYYDKMPEKFGKSLKGFFTDEPQYGNGARAPWSQVMPQEFENRYGYSLIDSLPMLYINNSQSAAVRSDFYNMVSDLFITNFIKQMYDWCTEHNCMLTGHMMNEENFLAIMRSTAGVMACYEYFHEPGIDWLGRKIETPFVPKQLGSVAAQLERKTMTETYALCGWDVSINELKWIGQWQYVNGVTSLCPHLEGYSMRGCRKRDYPASLFTQLPWFDKAYGHFADYFTRLGALLDSGKDYSPLLVMHPIQTAYVTFTPDGDEYFTNFDINFRKLSENLNGQHILYHYGDEILMKKYGSVDGDTLRIGACDYKAVLLPDLISIKKETAELLIKFAENGGKIYLMGDAPTLVDGRKNDILDKLTTSYIKTNDVAQLKSQLDYLGFANIATNGCENPNLHYCERILEDGKILIYIVNHSAEKQTATLTLKDSYELDLIDLNAQDGCKLNTKICDSQTVTELEFASYASAIILADCSKSEYSVKKSEFKNIVLDNIFKVSKCTDNALTLDFCEYRIDDGEWQPEMPIILLQNKLLALQRPCKIKMRFKFNIAEKINFESMSLCMETPEKFSVTVNGKILDTQNSDWFIDEEIRKIPLGKLIVEGINEIVVSGSFTQHPDVYRLLFTPGVHECETNKLTYDTELESLYLIGDFGVYTDYDYSFGERKTIFAGKTSDFVIKSSQNSVDIRNITPQGYWFFAGEMTLEQKFTLKKENGIRYRFKFEKMHTPAAIIKINGKEAGLMAFAPFEVDVTDFVVDGENTIEIIMLSGNRNLFGPHHRTYGESYSVTPATFSDQTDWGFPGSENTWTDNYSFVIFGAEL